MMIEPGDIANEFAKAWNAHDMTALRALFDEDAAFVNRFGHYVRGADAIVALHAPIHATVYSDSFLENEIIDQMTIADGAEIVHFWSRLTVGAAHPSGPHSVDTLIQAIVLRD